MQKRKDKHTPAQRSYNMSRIRSTNTQLEKMFFELLDSAGIVYEKHPQLHGKPDCLIQPNILIFVDSDFWHGWHFSKWKDRLPKEYWVEKIERNMHRDTQKFRTLRSTGYTVIRVWEHSLKKNPQKVLQKIESSIESTTD